MTAACAKEPDTEFFNSRIPGNFRGGLIFVARAKVARYAHARSREGREQLVDIVCW